MSSSFKAVTTKKRAKITTDDVRVIYDMRDLKGERGNSLALAERFGITQKAVRDIWCGRTWTRTTGATYLTSEREDINSTNTSKILRSCELRAFWHAIQLGRSLIITSRQAESDDAVF